MAENTDKQVRIYRDAVLKQITKNPGMVVFRDDIAEAVGITPEQVAGTVARFKSDNPIGNEIEIAIPGRAWRYVPNQRVRGAARAVSKPIVNPEVRGRKAGRTPLTESIRNYFRNNAGRVIYVDELQEMMSTEDTPLTHEQVRVGVSNARQNHDTFRNELTVISPGRAWQYTGLPDVGTDVQTTVDVPATGTSVAVPAVPPQPAAVPAVTAPVPVPAPLPAPAPPAASDDGLLLLEPLGVLGDGGTIYRDTNKSLYRVYRM